MQKNIVLIGMPGCGKTTVAKEIGKLTKRLVFDLDAMVEARYGKTIPDIFREEGEAGFREKETEEVKRVAEKSGVVVSCGGGVVLREENAIALKKNGVVVFVKRDVHALTTKGRPLSKDRETLEKMERERTPLYEKYADFAVLNDRTPEETAKEIIRFVQEIFGR